MVYGIWYMVYGIWCMVYGIWYMVYIYVAYLIKSRTLMLMGSTNTPLQCSLGIYRVLIVLSPVPSHAPTSAKFTLAPAVYGKMYDNKRTVYGVRY
ncbi:hypothetical protein EON63_15915 [archaeon]|nr:MAG: hypothetical protein EON63_15915 [archaeon]